MISGQMKKRYWIAGAATAAVAAKLLMRPRDVDWRENRDIIFHCEYSRFADVNGTRMHFQDAGDLDGVPLVLVHGFASSTLVWSKVFLRLADKGFRVLAPDLLGYGYSEKPHRGKYTIEAQAKALIGLLDRLEISRAIFIGSSYGGAVAATCALDYPDRVQKLILVGTVNNNAPLKFSLMRLFGSPVVGDVVAPLLIGSRRLLRMRMKKVYDRHSWVLDEQRVEARHRPLRTKSTQRAIIRTVRGWNADRVSADAHLIRQPTLLLWGETDREIPLADGQRLHGQIKGSRLVVFRECGHLPHEEYPESFTEVVTDFCADELQLAESEVLAG
jgi:pimeloyl-ACP methyl ester carboxylesterase